MCGSCTVLYKYKCLTSEHLYLLTSQQLYLMTSQHLYPLTSQHLYFLTSHHLYLFPFQALYLLLVALLGRVPVKDSVTFIVFAAGDLTMFPWASSVYVGIIASLSSQECWPCTQTRTWHRKNSVTSIPRFSLEMVDLDLLFKVRAVLWENVMLTTDRNMCLTGFGSCSRSSCHISWPVTIPG